MPCALSHYLVSAMTWVSAMATLTAWSECSWLNSSTSDTHNYLRDAKLVGNMLHNGVWVQEQRVPTSFILKVLQQVHLLLLLERRLLHRLHVHHRLLVLLKRRPHVQVPSL